MNSLEFLLKCIKGQLGKLTYNSKYYFTIYGINSDEGSGLGVLLCRDFVLKNNGRLWFESEENVGSVFSFSFPEFVSSSTV